MRCLECIVHPLQDAVLVLQHAVYTIRNIIFPSTSATMSFLRSLGGRSLVHFLFCFITLSCWSLLRTQRLSRHPHRPLLRALLRYLRVIPSPWPNYWSYTNRFVNFFKTNVSWYERFGRIEYQLPFLSLCENRRTKKWEKKRELFSRINTSLSKLKIYVIKILRNVFVQTEE